MWYSQISLSVWVSVNSYMLFYNRPMHVFTEEWELYQGRCNRKQTKYMPVIDTGGVL